MYMVIAHDRPGQGTKEARQHLLAAHLDYIESILGAILVAGPFTEPNGEICGSLLILDVADEEEARVLVEADPYASGPIWESIEYHPYRGVAGRWVGGKTWAPRTDPIALAG